MRTRSLTVVLVAAGTMAGAAPAMAATAHPVHPVHLPTAQIFATNNTAIITNPKDPRLKTKLLAFAREVSGIVRTHGARPGASTLLDGVFWDSTRKKMTYERSREFDVNHVGPASLHHIADILAKRFHQDSVLTFRYLPKKSKQANGIEVTVPGLTVQKLFNGLKKDTKARDELSGGSVTVSGGRLILIAGVKDLSLVHRFVTELGANWSKSTTRYGAEDFVS